MVFFCDIFSGCLWDRYSVIFSRHLSVYPCGQSFIHLPATYITKVHFSWEYCFHFTFQLIFLCQVVIVLLSQMCGYPQKYIYRSILCLPDLFTCGKRCQTIQNIAVFFHCRYFVYFFLMKSKGIFFVLYHIHIGDHSLTFLCENGLSWWFANRQWMACKTVVKFCHIAQTDH